MHRRSFRLSASPTQGLGEVLDNADAVARLTAHARSLSALQRAYLEVTPAWLGTSSRVLNYKNGTLVIRADSPAVAAKLRQLLPTIQASVSRGATQVTRIEVRVQPEREFGHDLCAPHAPPGTLPPGSRPLGVKPKNALSRLAETLDEASPVRRAIRHLLERAD